MHARPTQRGPAAGFTLIEILIAFSTLAIVFGSFAAVWQAGTKLYGTGNLVTQLEAKVSRSVDRVARETMNAGISTLIPNPGMLGSDQLTFQGAVGILDGEAAWSSQISLRFEYEEGEVDDGQDNNGNGLVDEGCVVWRRSPGALDEERSVWIHQVREYLEGEIPNGLDDNGNGLIDERGFSYQLSGETLTIRMTLEQVNSEGLVVTRTQETAVRLRN